MGRTFRYGDEDDEKILGHGDRLVVPMAMMDGSMDHLDPLQRAVLRDRLQGARITDGAGDGGLALHRPGYRVANGVPREHSHYAAYDAEIASAYKNAGASERKFTGGRVGDVGGGRSGNEGSACVTDDNLSNAVPVRDARERAYLDYENLIQNKWRDGR